MAIAQIELAGWLTVEQTAARLGVAAASVRRQVGQGVIEAPRAGARTLYVSQASADAWAEQPTSGRGRPRGAARKPAQNFHNYPLDI